MTSGKATGRFSIERYLGSGMIRGIGPIFAKRLVKTFGEAVFDIIEADPNRLREVDGIDPKRAAKIAGARADQRAICEIMVFLHEPGVGTARAVRIFKTYGTDAVQVMSENPYRLARDIRGIGFRTADVIVEKLGIERTAMIRVRAVISFALTDAMGEDSLRLSDDGTGCARGKGHRLKRKVPQLVVLTCSLAQGVLSLAKPSIAPRDRGAAAGPVVRRRRASWTSPATG
jgi:hypothetical protein